MLYKVEHEIHGDVILNTNSGMFHILKPDSGLWFVMNDNSLNYFNSFNDFLLSNTNICIIRAWCSFVKNKKATFIDIKNNTIIFKQWETKIGNTWIRNKIGIDVSFGNTVYMNALKPYFLVLKKNNYYLNDCELKSYILITDNLEYKIINTKIREKK